MTGYTAAARLDGVAPRIASHAGEAAARAKASDAYRSARPTAVVVDGEAVATVAARLDELRTGWSELTFYLLDPESWR